MIIGVWKNFDDLESSLTLEELDELLRALYAKEGRSNEFLAAVNGVELKGNSSGVDKFEEVKARAQRRLMADAAEKVGKDEQTYVLEGLGFGIG